MNQPNKRAEQNRFEKPEGLERLDEDLLELVTIRDIDDVNRAARALADIVSERGMTVAICSDISSKEPMVDAEGLILNSDIFGWDDQDERWWENSRLALQSPIPRACRYESEPFWVNSRGIHTQWPNKFLEGIDLREFAGLSLRKASIVVPTHLPFGQIAASSFASQNLRKSNLASEFAEYGQFFGALASRFVAGYVQAQRGQRWIPSDCKLAKREVECLRWAAAGKTDAEIGIILGRSHPTIRYHMQRACEKLNCVNKYQTIFKAAQLGYIAIDH